MILPEKSFSGNILVILDDPLDQKVKYDFNIYAIGARLIHCFGVILTR